MLDDVGSRYFSCFYLEIMKWIRSRWMCGEHIQSPEFLNNDPQMNIFIYTLMAVEVPQLRAEDAEDAADAADARRRPKTPKTPEDAEDAKDAEDAEDARRRPKTPEDARRRRRRPKTPEDAEDARRRRRRPKTRKTPEDAEDARRRRRRRRRPKTPKTPEDAEDARRQRRRRRRPKMPQGSEQEFRNSLQISFASFYSDHVRPTPNLSFWFILSHVLSTSLGPTTQHVQHMKQVDLSSHSASHYHKI